MKIQLSESDRERLESIISDPKSSKSCLYRAKILLHFDNLRTNTIRVNEYASDKSISVRTIYQIIGLYKEGGLENAVYPKKRTPTTKVILTEEVEAKLLELFNQKPPINKKRWSNRLLAEEAVRLGIVEKISSKTIEKFVNKYNLREEPGAWFD